MITVIALLPAALTGCGDLPEQPTPTSLETPVPVRSVEDVVAAARPSVVKIRTVASSCQTIIEGTGFVIAPNLVLTNAHVVAGGESFTVETDGDALDARVVYFDPKVDISVIDVPQLSAQPLSLASSAVTAGTEALVLSYPNAGSFVAMPVRIREITELNGPDIYRTTEATRQVYIVDAADGRPLQGVSGSPLIDMNGGVLGVVFGAGTEHLATGFAVASIEIAPQLAAIGNAQPVATGACIS
jgi:S1-C subfamily serine protease